MTITLTPEQLAWIDERVARGEYASQDDAAQRLIDAAILDHAVCETDDLAWAKPLVDDGLADVAAGRVMSFADYKADVQAYLDSLGTR